MASSNRPATLWQRLLHRRRPGCLRRRKVFLADCIHESQEGNCVSIADVVAGEDERSRLLTLPSGPRFQIP